MSLHFNIIGTGKLGFSLASSLVKSTNYTLRGVVNRNESKSSLVVSTLGQGIALSSISLLPPAAIAFIATPDKEIAQVVSELVSSTPPGTHSHVVHVSGALNSDSLSPLKELGCSVASMHPLKAFPPLPVLDNEFKGVDCILEGDEKSLVFLRQLLSQLQGRTVSINKDKKVLYHMGAVIASNYLITLAENASKLFAEAGIGIDEGLPMITRLMEGALQNLAQEQSPNRALTGPISRGDSLILQKHLDACPDKEIAELYKALGRASMKLVNHPAHVMKELGNIFDNKD